MQVCLCDLQKNEKKRSVCCGYGENSAEYMKAVKVAPVVSK
jgi:hypothetical protein